MAGGASEQGREVMGAHGLARAAPQLAHAGPGCHVFRFFLFFPLTEW